MNNQVQIIKKQRRFSVDFKRSIVTEYESGIYSVPQLGRLHNISLSLIYGWIYRYSTLNERGTRMVERIESSEHKLKAMQKKIEDLERAVGQKQIAIDYLEKMIDLAQSELGIDIKKNFDTPQSNGLKSTATK
jgi:transposase